MKKVKGKKKKNGKWNCEVFGHEWVCNGVSNAGAEWRCSFCGKERAK